ncbi:NAD-dependent epimerase/dehydratase family protein [Falsiroseomonas selenitidurans]|uniref:NAD(P)-dependent oxidoreductase n=1 Tax=Falsiroseomonas selenitidurans TaxID=2716335 RepID=A0ABX1E830_9PROT|nr:NAD(P)-dependent oxidoreductase [Falsiroseomonas selenitidurans]NKC33380.1 NAD(P)-dependent oxidoreductase [Falsiroseomonas selenitidurans]
MHVLVTGGAGYIGSMLVPALLARGWQVTVLDTFAAGEPFLAHACADPNFTPVRGDCRDMRVLEPLLKQADIAIPLAALVGAPLCARDEIGAKSLNRDAVLDLVKRASPSQLIAYPTTNSGYGVGEGNAFCTEETPLRPVSLYGRTKVEAEEAVLSHANALSFRLATVFGMAPRMRLDLLVNDFTWRAVNDRAVVLFEAHFRRNYIHIRDVVKAFLHGIDNVAAMKGQAYNVGLSEANLSKAQLCDRIAKHVPGFVWLEAPVGEDPDKRDYVVSNDKLEATGWMPDHGLDKGIQELIKGYRMLRNGRFANV